MENADIQRPNIKISYRDDIVMAVLQEEEILEDSLIKNMSDSLIAIAQKNAPVKMILNFARVKRLSSASLGTFIRLNANIENSGGKLAFCRLTPILLQLFLITKLEKIFSIYPDEESAVKGLNK